MNHENDFSVEELVWKYSFPGIGTIPNREACTMLGKILGYYWVEHENSHQESWVIRPREEEVQWVRWRNKQSGETEYYLQPSKVDWYFMAWNALMEQNSKVGETVFEQIKYILKRMPNNYNEALKIIRPEVPVPALIAVGKKKRGGDQSIEFLDF